MTDPLATTGYSVRLRKGWLGNIAYLLVCLIAFVWAGSAADPRDALPWAWTASGWVIPARGLAVLWLASAALFTTLSRIAWRLRTDWPAPPNAIRWPHVLTLFLLVVAVYAAIAACWTPLQLNSQILLAPLSHSISAEHYAAILATFLTTGILCTILLLEHRSVWWAALFALHPLTLWECAGNGNRLAFGSLVITLLVLAARWLPAKAKAALLLLCALAAIIIVATTSNDAPFNSLSALLPIAPSTIVRTSIELLLQAALLLLAWRRRWTFAKTLGHIVLFTILLMNAVPPAMLLLPLALIPLAWNRAAWILSLAIIFAYAAIPQFRETGQWGIPPILATLLWIPVIVVATQELAIEAFAFIRRPQPSPASFAA